MDMSFLRLHTHIRHLDMMSQFYLFFLNLNSTLKLWVEGIMLFLQLPYKLLWNTHWFQNKIGFFHESHKESAAKQTLFFKTIWSDAQLFNFYLHMTCKGKGNANTVIKCRVDLEKN